MRIINQRHITFCAALLIVASSSISSVANAQTHTTQTITEATTQQTSTSANATGAAAETYRTDVYCTGFIEYGSSYGLEIIGAEQEQTRRVFSQGDNVYVSGGKQQGLRVGQEFSIVRPRGMFKGHWTKKKDWLGVYTQEVGRLHIVNVKDRVSLAVIDASCEVAQFGDYLRPIPRRSPPTRYDTSNLDRFSDPTNKQRGRIVLARGGREMLATNDIVYIDLGSEDGVKINDALTVYRKLGKGTVTNFRDDNIVLAASGGFESFAFKGGKFSNQANRVKHPNSNGVYGPTTNFPKIQRRRPPMPRKIVGEIVVTDVQQRTATAIVTRVAEEIHTGDHIELQ